MLNFIMGGKVIREGRVGSGGKGGVREVRVGMGQGGVGRNERGKGQLYINV